MFFRRARRILAFLVPITVVGIFLGLKLLPENDEWFVPQPFALKQTARLFDVGIVDANGDDFLDIYTSNHHFRQALLIADGKGEYVDVLSAWGLDQNREFPLAELSFDVPVLENAGVYVYWRGANLVIRAHQTSEIGAWSGSLRIVDFDPVKVLRRGEGRVETHEKKTGSVIETRIDFTVNTDDVLILTPGGQGVPIDFEFRGELKPAQIFVGLGAVSPKGTDFSLAMQDRHALAWADFNDDGVLDVFITRGALGGRLRLHAADVADRIKDELFLSDGKARFVEVASRVGIQKKACSGRHAKWVDFNNDGLLDLFVNCYDRELAFGRFPKQLYRQEGSHALRDVAENVGLGLPDQQMGNVVWFDADADNDMDLLAFQDDGLFLYRNEEGSFFGEELASNAARGEEEIGHTTGSSWFYDGKLSIADYDADGDLDIFCSSKRGSLLLNNHAGSFEAIGPTSVGLPAASMTANWVDYDNDGVLDLHLFPQGLYRQLPGNGFETTGLLAVEPEEYQAAVVNWFDMDNDGRLDVLMVVDPNPLFKRWWDFAEPPRQKGVWNVLMYRNVGPTDHWLQVVLAGTNGNQQGIGARVTVVTAEGEQSQEVGSSEGAFFSQGHYRLYFGLGPSSTVDAIRIRWSDGASQELRNVKADQLVRVARQTAPIEDAGTR